VFIDEDNLTDYFALKEKNDIEIYGKLQFSPDKVDKIRANFVRSEYYVGGITDISLTAYQNIFGERKIIEADGAVIIKLTQILKE